MEPQTYNIIEFTKNDKVRMVQIFKMFDKDRDGFLNFNGSENTFTQQSLYLRNDKICQ